MKPLAIIIITYNRPHDLLALLKNIALQQGADALLRDVVIVNNASTEDYSPVTGWLEGQSLPFRYVYSEENLGVARGRNLAISLTEAPVLITIDDDAWFRDNNALELVLAAFGKPLAQQRRAGVLSFKVLYASTGMIQQNAFPHKKFEKYRDKEQFLASYYIGCGHAILKEVYDAAGVYPEDFFYGMEEYDLSYRVLQQGYAIVYDASIVVMHNESPLGRAPQEKKLRMLWLNKSKVAYRYLPFIYFITTACMWSLEYLQKTSWNIGGWLKTWGKAAAVPFKEKRRPLGGAAMKYLKETEARLWY